MMELSEIKTDLHIADNNIVKRESVIEIRGTVPDVTKPETYVSANKTNVFAKQYNTITTFVKEHRRQIVIFRNVILFLAFCVYLVFAVTYRVGDEGSWRLIGFSILGVYLLALNLLKKTKVWPIFTSAIERLFIAYSIGKRSLVFRWFLYILMTLFMTGYVILAVAIKTPENLRSLMGLAVFPFALFLYSNNKRKVNWHTVFWAMSLQFIMALLILKTSWGASVISWVGARLSEFINNANAGSEFIFGEKWVDHSFAMGAMVQAMTLVVGISVLTYLGVITFIVETVGRLLSFCLQLSPSEGINAVGNIFLHVPESAMLIQDYLNTMTPSQLFVTYAGGLSTVGGVSLVIFMSSGVPASPLVAASAMSAPAALAAAKIAFPSHDEEEAPTPPENNGQQQKTSLLRKPKSMAEAVIIGINQGVVLVVQAIAFIMTFVIILRFINNTLTWFGDRVGIERLTIEMIFAYVFYPFAFLMGARHEDCLFIGELLGIRTFSLAVVAYPKLGPIIQNGQAYREYIAESVNNTWSKIGNDIYLENINKTLVGGIMQERSEVIATYALCGSASFAIMGLIIGSFEAIVPHRTSEITQHILRAMVVGTVASYLTACFAGLLFEESIGTI